MVQMGLVMFSLESVGQFRSVTSDVFWKCKCSFVYGGEVSVVGKGKMKVNECTGLVHSSCTEWSTWLWLQLLVWEYQYQVYGTEVDKNKPILGLVSLQNMRHWETLNYMWMHEVVPWVFNVQKLLLIFCGTKTTGNDKQVHMLLYWDVDIPNGPYNV